MRSAFRTAPNGYITSDCDLGTLGGGTISTGCAINSAGQAVGLARTNTNAPRFLCGRDE